MKVVCIDNKNYEKELTLNKTYIEIDIFRVFNDDAFYFIINDNNIKNMYIKNRFKSLSEIRVEKIDKLLK